MKKDVKFALNHMVGPRYSFEEFTDKVRKIGLDAVEFRNDIGVNSIDSLEKAKQAGVAAKNAGVEVLTINALYPFNIWEEALSDKANTIADYAAACNAKALVLVPLNEASPVFTDNRRKELLQKSLQSLKPILEARNLLGYVEVLGFPISSMRCKNDVVSMLDELDFNETFKLVHDTFHHRIANEQDYFASHTGLVHISGVEDQYVTFEEMQDSHRILVGPKDRLGNISQIKRLVEAGYKGYISFEPFSEPVWNLENPIGAAKDSIDYILSNL